MFIRTKKASRNDHIYVQLVESYRENGKKKQRVLKHIGTGRTPEKVEQLKQLAEVVKNEYSKSFSKTTGPKKLAHVPVSAKAPLVALSETARHTLGIHDVYGSVYDRLDFNTVLKNPKMDKILREIVLSRIAKPMSKRASATWLSEECGVQLKLEQVYRMMDKIDESIEERIQEYALRGAKQLTKGSIKILFYDVTTLYFESFSQDDLKQNGFSKDRKFNQPQVLLALFVTQAGLPVGYEVFPGSTFEGHTFVPMIEKLKKRFQIDEIVIVADRGMVSKDNIKYLDKHNISYIVGARLKSSSNIRKKDVLDWAKSLDKEHIKTGATHRLDVGNGQSIILSYRTDRAKKDSHDREVAIEKLLARLKRNKNPKQLISNYGYQKFIALEGQAKLVLDEEKLEAASEWDGIIGIITNDSKLSNEEVISQYRGLWQVEESFRVCKSDLAMRPIYHWTPKRVKAHIALAFVAFTCVRYLGLRVEMQHERLSPEVIRRNLLHVQASLVEDKTSKKCYFFPSPLSATAKQLYRICDIKPPQRVMRIN